MKLGMLVPEFPTQTHLFFWREIEAIRALGHEVHIISTKRPLESCPHAFAQQATTQTHYVYPPDKSNVMRSLPHAMGIFRCFKYLLSLSVPLARKVRGVGYILCAADLATYARAHKLDHIHVHSCADAAHIAAMAHFLGGPTYSLHLHGDLPVYGVDHPQKSAAATFVAAAARPMQQQLIDIVGLPVGRTETLWMGVDTADFEPRVPLDHGKPLHLVSISRLHVCKGHKYTLEAMRMLLDQGVDLRYSIAGSGPHKQDIEDSIAAFGLQDKVTLVGSLGEAGVRDLLAKADVFVLSSVGIGEASPVAVMEAMAAGVPVISSIIGGTPDMIKDGEDGLLVPQEDVAAIAQAIQRLAADFAFRAGLAKAARKRAVAQFDYHITAKKLIDAILKPRTSR